MLLYKVLLGVSLPVYLVISLLIMVGNALVLRLLLRRVLRDGITLLMVSLVSSDLAIGLVALPMAMLFNTEIVLPFQPCLWLTCTNLCWIIVSTLHHLVIAIDRWHRLAKPARYLSSATRMRAILHITACWTLAFCCAYVPVLGYNNHDLLCEAAAASPNGTSVAWLGSGGQLRVLCQYLVVLDLNYLVYVFFMVCTLLPVLATSILYLLMLVKSKARVTTGTVGECLYDRQQRHLTGKMLVAVLAYALLKAPFSTLNCVFLYCPNCQVPYWVAPFVSSLDLISAIFNPCIIFLTHKEARDSLCKALRWKRWRTGDTVVMLVEEAPQPTKE